MPKRNDIQSILVIGSGPIIIGQALEFDYSGVQCCKTLKSEGYKAILMNSNPATIMTDAAFADVTYIEPLLVENVVKIIDKERPDAVIPTVGGQVGINIAMELNKLRPEVEILGVDEHIIRRSEDRHEFRALMKDIGIFSSRSIVISGDDDIDIDKIINDIGLPVIIRPSYTLGGTGGQTVYKAENLKDAILQGLYLSPINHVLIEESLVGHKEIEFEILRDSGDNCMSICCIENIDPMGIHTGDSMSVVPCMTLTDRELQDLRYNAFKCVSAVGVVGSSNVQFSINPDNGKYCIIEMNPRLSRSSALSSKATGFPIASVSTLLTVGYSLAEVQHKDGVSCHMEPTIDYVVVKVPRFSFDHYKPEYVNANLNSSMKSVGEVIGIGRCFEEALNNAINSVDPDMVYGNKRVKYDLETISRRLEEFTYNRLAYIFDALRFGMDVETLYSLSLIDKWFLFAMKRMVDAEKTLHPDGIANIDIFHIKRYGFPDAYIADRLKITLDQVDQIKKSKHANPVFKKIDMSAGLITRPHMNYLYRTYEISQYSESAVTNKKKVIIIGSGPNIIGQGIEFDYCCVNGIVTFKSLGYEVLVLNNNPATVSTDYDISDKLYIMPINIESVLDIYNAEKKGTDEIFVFPYIGGQTSLLLIEDMIANKIPIIGMDFEKINICEDRNLFAEFISNIGLKAPQFKNIKDVDNIDNNIQFPLMVRKSYIIGGSDIKIARDANDLKDVFNNIENCSDVYIDELLEYGVEYDVDIVCFQGVVHAIFIMEHVDPVGIHSGDSLSCMPTKKTSPAHIALIENSSKTLVKHMNASGFINIQCAMKDDELYFIEVNPRASRSLPFASKASGVNLIDLGIKLLVVEGYNKQASYYDNANTMGDRYAFKAPVFSCGKLINRYEFPGPVMKSTGEAMGWDYDYHTAFLKSQTELLRILMSKTLEKGIYICLSDDSSDLFDYIINRLYNSSYKLYTEKFGGCKNNDRVIECNLDDIVERIKNKEIGAIMVNRACDAANNIINKATILNIPCFTNSFLIKLTVDALSDTPDLGFCVHDIQSFALNSKT